MSLLEQNIKSIPSPCYVMEEEALRKNLRLIQRVAERADVEIILAFKAFALWKSFPIFREYIQHTTASSPYEARLAFEEFGSPAHTYSPAYEEETFAEGTKLTYCVTAKNKNGESEKSKTAKITFTTKDKYKKVRKAFAKYAKKNGSESPKGTYNLVSLDVTGSTSILGASYVENQDSIGFTYIGGDDNTFYTIILTYTPNTDPCIVYSGFDADSNMTGTAMIFINPAKVTKKTKFTKNDAFVIEDESDGAVDHIAIINEGVQEIFAYAKKVTSKIDGVSMKKLGFKNYK